MYDSEADAVSQQLWWETLEEFDFVKPQEILESLSK